jgi:hypothetical protein
LLKLLRVMQGLFLVIFSAIRQGCNIGKYPPPPPPKGAKNLRRCHLGRKKMKRGMRKGEKFERENMIDKEKT